MPAKHGKPPVPASITKRIRNWALKGVGNVLLHAMHVGGVEHYKRHGMPRTRNTTKDIERYKHWAYTCIKRNATSVAQAKLRLYATRSTGEAKAGARWAPYGLTTIGKPVSKARTLELKDRYGGMMGRKAARIQDAEDIEEIVDHPFNDLMQSMNPRHNYFDSWELQETLLGLTGCHYWLVERDPSMDGTSIPKYLWPLRPDLVTIVPSTDSSAGLIKGYLYGTPGRQVAFTADEIINFRYANPQDLYYYGFSPLKAGGEAVDRYSLFNAYENSLLANNGVPDMMAKYKGHMDPDTLNETQLMWDQSIATPFQNRRIKVADEDWSIEKLSFSPKEMAYLLGRKWTREEICGTYGVPIALVTSENVNRANMEGALFQYNSLTVFPKLRRDEETLNQDLIPMYNEPRLFAAFDSPVPEDREFQQKQEEQDLKMGVITINEVREQRARPSTSWGDQPWMPTNTAPAASIMSGAVQPTTGKLLNAAPEDVKPITKSEWEAVWWKAEDEDIDRTGGPNPRVSTNEKRIIRIIEKSWRDLEPEVLRNVAKIKSVKAGEQALFDFDAYVTGVSELTRPIISDVYIRGGNAGLSEISVSMAEWVEDPEVGKEIDRMNFKFADNLGDEVNTNLRAQLRAGVDAGETTRELQTRMRGVFKGLVHEKRAKMIAQTETARATSKGHEQGWAQSGVVDGKIWDALDDACPFCEPLDGQVVGLGRSFKDPTTGKISTNKDGTYEIAGGVALDEGRDYVVPFKEGTSKLPISYEDTKTPPLHPRCRCALRPLVTVD